MRGKPLLAALPALLTLFALPSGAVHGQFAPADPPEAAPEHPAWRAQMAETVWRHMEAFGSVRSRALGYPGHEQAAEHIIREFKRLGLEPRFDEFERAVPLDEGAFVEWQGRRVPVACFWPNLVRTPTTPPEGITGKLFYARDGQPEHLAGVDLSECIVVLDFDCRDRYLIIRSLGAKAILFRPQEQPDRGSAVSKVLDAPVMLPRYLLSHEAWEALRPAAEARQEVTVQARMTWQRVAAKNIFARLAGRDPKYDHEPIVLMSFYDAGSVVPSIAPGADEACGISTLLWLAEHFSRQPALRPVWFLALDSHAVSLGGIDQFVVRHCLSGRTYDDWAAQFIKMEPPDRRAEDLIHPALLVDLNISSGTQAMGVFWDGNGMAGNEFHRNSVMKVGDVFARAARDLNDRHPGMQFFNGIRPVQGVTWQSYLPTAVMFDSTVALKVKVHAVALATALDTRQTWDTPLDTLDRVDRANLLAQAALVTDMLAAALNDETLVRRNISENDFRAYKWPMWPFICKANRSRISDRPVTTEPMADALVVLRAEARSPWFAGGYATEVGLSGPDGHYVDLLADHIRLYTYGYKLDERDGSIIYAADRGQEGEGRQPLDVSRKSNGIVVLFRCVTMDLYDMTDPIRFKEFNTYTVMLPTGGQPQKFGYCWIPRNDARPCMTVHVPRGERIRFAAGRGMFGFQYLLLNATPAEPEGEGILLNEETPVTFGNLLALRDLVTLNEARFDRLVKKGISNELVGRLLAQAAGALTTAEQARQDRDWDAFLKAVYEGLGYATTAYPMVKGMARDTVQGVVFYFALLIPFAFFLERLLFGFPDIRKQIAMVGGIFLLVFAIMGLVHPAFEISDSPYVIFLSFIIMALAAIVLTMVVGKFGEQMKELRAAGGEVHRVDVGRISATMAAVMLGISNLRKRRVRTVLTTATIVLLTFAVLSFTVVSNETQYYRVPRPYAASHTGVLFRDRNWMPISGAMLDYVRYAFRAEEGRGPAVVAPRAWVFIERDNQLVMPIRGPRGEYRVPGALGIVPAEAQVTGLDQLVIKGRWLGADDAPECLLPSTVAEAMDVDLTDPARRHVEAFGLRWEVVGILDARRLADFVDLDGEQISPIKARTGKESAKYAGTAASEMQLEAEARRTTDIEAVSHADPQNTPIFAYYALARCGGRLMSVAVGGVDPAGEDVKAQLEGLLARSNLLAFVGYADGEVRAVSATSRTGVGWASGLIVPVIIASLIVLNTMLGSVYERQREISTYSSVGLAPSHIAALFLAESSVFAVVGAFAGYLLGQGIVKVLMVTGLLGGININYSSTAAVLTSVIVMAVVLLSAVYPSKVAARLAVPDVTRRWQFPPPQGDLWRFEFPFTVADWQVLGLFAFLADFFAACAEESVGVFYTRNTQFTREGTGGGARHRIELDVWLAPYDLGVSQHVVLLAEPTEDPHIHRIEMTIVRRTGEHAAWQQRNRAFLAELRRQFLIYRTIPETAKGRWEAKALEQFNGADRAAGAPA